MNATETNVRKELGLSAGEWEALRHRLDAVDAVAEALTDYAEGEPAHTTYAREDVELVCQLLADGNIVEARNYSDSITMAVLEDAITGSTWAGSATGEPGMTYPNAVRQLKGAARKVSAYIGRECVPPLD